MGTATEPQARAEVPVLEPDIDCVVIVCRGVERVDTGDGKKWVPVGDLQKIPLERGATRSIDRQDISKDDPEGFVACAEANAQAGYKLVAELAAKNGKFPLMIISGGSPKYLQQAIKDGLAPEGFSEAVVVEQYLKDEFGNLPETILETASLNTKGNVEESLKIAREHGCTSVVFVNVQIAMPRTVVFYHTDVVRMFSDIAVRFATSQSILKKTMSGQEAELYQKVQDALLESAAGKRTAHGELIGCIRQVDGAYTRTGQY